MTNSRNDISITMKLTLEEMYAGVTKGIKYKRIKPCTDCDTKGCSTCEGKGLVLKKSIEEIEIPAGVDTGMVLNFKRKGNYFIKKKTFLSFLSDSKNGVGNLIVNIAAKKHDRFVRDKDDLIYYCQTDRLELIGPKKVIELQHLNGEVIKFQIPNQVIDGNILRIGGKGFKNLKTSQVGSLMIVMKVG